MRKEGREGRRGKGRREGERRGSETAVDGELNVVYKGRHRRHQKKYSCSSAPCICNNLLWMAKKYLDFSLNPFFSFFFFFVSAGSSLQHAGLVAIWHMGS